MIAETIDYNRKWLVMLAVAMGVFLSTLDGSIVNVALPTLVRDLDTTFATVQWVSLAYLLTITVLMTSIGRWADIVGKKPIYASGFVIFTIGSVLCGAAPGIYWLIAFRVLQGIGGAMVMALGIAVVTEAFPPQERGRAIGIMGGLVSVGIMVGPALGGILIDWLSWRTIFWINLPVGILGTFMVWRFVQFVQPKGTQTFDYLGSVLLFGGLLTLLLGLTLAQQIGLGVLPVGLWLVAIIFAVAFVITEKRVAQPMVDLSLFQNTLFSVNLTTGFMTFVAIAGLMVLIPFYLENVLALSPRNVGALIATIPIVLAVVAPFSGNLSDRIGVRPVTVVGLIFLLVGYGLLSQLNAETTPFQFLIFMLPIGLGMGMFQSPNNSAVMGAVSRNRLGIASGLLGLSRTLGQTVGIALLGAVWAWRTLAFSPVVTITTPSNAPIAAQVYGLQQVIWLIIGLIGMALFLSSWGWYSEIQRRRR